MGEKGPYYERMLGYLDSDRKEFNGDKSLR